MTAADTENRLIALSLATCQETRDISCSAGCRSDAVLVCTLPAGHEGLHYDRWDGIDWQQHDNSKGLDQ